MKPSLMDQEIARWTGLVAYHRQLAVDNADFDIVRLHEQMSAKYCQGVVTGLQLALYILAQERQEEDHPPAS